jgi:hypothetical protein
MNRKTINDYKENLNGIFRNIGDWLDEGKKLIISLVKENGGFLPTPQCEEKPALYVFYEDFDGKEDKVSIQGLRWDDEHGLCLCTNDMLENYQYDTGYFFGYFGDFKEENLEHLNKVLADPAYYVEWDKYNLVSTDTILNLLGGLPEYL